MELISQILNNKVLIISCLGYLISGIIKVFIDAIVFKKFSLRNLVRSGGMPSSHTATVVSLTVALGLYEGFNSSLFATATILTIIVIHDAVGVRRETGKQARVLNEIVNTPGLSSLQVREKLIEAVGHTPKQVFVGAIIGVVIGLVA